MSDLTTTVDTYLAAWNEPDRERRTSLIEEVWVPEGRLVDPPLEGYQHEGINDAADALHIHYSRHRFRRTSGVDAHHEFFRFSWDLIGPDGAVAITGIDVGEVEDNGKLRRITGFFGELTAHESS